MDLKKVGLAIAVALIVISALGWFALSRSSNGTTAETQGPADNWHVREDHSQMDDTKTAVLSMDSDDEIEGPLGRSKPTLIVRCKEGKTQVYIDTGMAASVEEDFEGGPIYTHTVRIRLDQSDAVTEHWSESTDHKALFSSDDGIEFAKHLAGAQTLTFQFIPFDANPAVARFNLHGLDAHLPKVADACGWNVN
jgi:hypothetical protein